MNGYRTNFSGHQRTNPEVSPRGDPAYSSEPVDMTVSPEKAFEILKIRLETCQDLAELLMEAELVPSKSAGRRAIRAGAIRLNNTKINDPSAKVFFDEGQWCAAENWKNRDTILITVFGGVGDNVEFRKLEIETEPGETLTLNKI